jgi:hypothetical protein
MSYLSYLSFVSYLTDRTYRAYRTYDDMAFIDAAYGLEYNPLAAQGRKTLPETQPHDQVQQLRY